MISRQSSLPNNSAESSGSASLILFEGADVLGRLNFVSLGMLMYQILGGELPSQPKPLSDWNVLLEVFWEKLKNTGKNSQFQDLVTIIRELFNPESEIKSFRDIESVLRQIRAKATTAISVGSSQEQGMVNFDAESTNSSRTALQKQPKLLKFIQSVTVDLLQPLIDYTVGVYCVWTGLLRLLPERYVLDFFDEVCAQIGSKIDEFDRKQRAKGLRVFYSLIATLLADHAGTRLFDKIDDKKALQLLYLLGKARKTSFSFESNDESLLLNNQVLGYENGVKLLIKFLEACWKRLGVQMFNQAEDKAGSICDTLLYLFRNYPD
ncbi:MAG: hypothetical protein NZT61_06270, partial [Deltaproteobacteria bacterium]|nr:hypothetical protein [Deltaproteobacteria bacterium]